jgi:hypothetical protein
MAEINRLANLTQLKISGTLVTSNNSFPILLPQEIRGGIRQCEDYLEMLAIPTIFLEVGQLAYLKNSRDSFESGYYFLETADRIVDGTLSNVKWTRFGLSGSSAIKKVNFNDADQIVVAHNFGYNPTVIINDIYGSEIEGQITYMDSNTLEVMFNVKKTGQITIK